ncbi:AAA family ATPase [Limosilactobacillus caecicola]|uniref:AAA family ATPase n=1 Tax=Limosilactobacillus caecicola TaxID=2941332 RepID=UPI00203F2A72|nr:SMC family ATPase [Limosilactobacillus caecicola]
MQPIKLRLRYFGPYRDQLIDFTKLNQTPIFLISGNTGSGKTTIFDAMCFALFGQTTNDQDRDAAALRSDFAPDDQETIVEFTFAHQGKTYQITRKPKQTLVGRGDRLVEHGTKVSLVYPLESDQPEEITKVSEANAYIEKLLNLTRTQFKQIILLPQGKFRQFLASSSSDKEALLRDLFDTNLYEQWTQVLKQRLAEQRKQNQTVATKITTLKENLSDVNSQLSADEWRHQVQQLLAAKEQDQQNISREINTVQDHYQVLQKRLNQEQSLRKAIQDRQKTRRELDQLNQQAAQIAKIKEMIGRLTWYREHQTAYNDWQNLVTKLGQQRQMIADEQKNQQQLTSQQQKIAERSNKLELQAAEINQIQEQKNVLKNQLPLFAQQTRLAEQVIDQQKVVKRLQAKLTKHQTIVDQSQEQLGLNTQKLTAMDNPTDQQLALTNSQHQLQSGQKLLDDYDEDYQREQRLAKQVENVHKELTEQQKLTAQAETDYDDLKDAHARSEIARLAKNLKDGIPCPVCGSTTHPCPAVVTTDRVVSNTEVEAANQRLSQLQEKAAALTSRRTELQKQIQQSQADQRKQLQALTTLIGADINTSEEAHQWLANTKGQVQNDTTRFAKSAAHYQKLQTEQEQLTTIVAESQKVVEKLQAQLHPAEMEMSRLKASLTTTEKNLPSEFSDEVAATKQLDKWQRSITDYNEEQTQVRQLQGQLSEQLAASKTKLTSAQQQVTSAEQQSAKLKEQLLAALSDFSADLTWDFWQWATDHVSQLTSYQEQVQKYQERQARLNSLLHRFNQQIGDRQPPEIEQTTAELTQASEQLNQLQQRSGELQNELKQIHSVVDQITELTTQQNAELAKIQNLQTLSDVMSGNTDNKLSLERYVLQSYLTEVLQVANIRLASLTNGRYAFKLSDQQGRGNGTKWSGLEINVYDDNAGQERSARTLSGGESFIASLALALGLGEVIQERSGGIQVDALFVDEGFGSLDQDALQQALNALASIQGYKMIGIISHVTELEQAVPNQLEVISDHGVSHIKYHEE